ncbi:DUF1836 domain-containing protein [Ornithinibacillus gellani]|uniref:DUF1836 domain-containing protein n=1 Tax=Ornithinibacillus gellani TaxID=2293253 RepID=UPI000F494CB5|nr:DUF1836 domain-containing protein [Ornithinibacillus gellani]TQS74751.1 DUF1836 domain-containing protein [Ornithinibacillus gellani]
MKNIKKVIEDMHLETHLSLEDIPDIDLYMDQVIQLFETKFADAKRNDEEKILTKTMINNYAKGKLFFPIQNKKYSRDHLIMISLIYQMKGTLSINDIKESLQALNVKAGAGAIDLSVLYESFLQISEKNAEQFSVNSNKCADIAAAEMEKFPDADKAYLGNLLLLASFVNLSNFYRRAAEKIVDEMNKPEA